MTMLDFGMEVMPQPREVAIAARNATVLSVNLEVAAHIEHGSPVTAHGVPKNYPDAKKLVTEDCIKPLDTGGK